MNAVEQHTIAQALQRIQHAYPRQAFPVATVQVYAEELADLDDALVYDAVVTLIRTSTYFPTVAQIRERVAEIACALPTVDQAWAMVLVGTRVPVIEVRESLNAVGGRWEVDHGDNPTAVRAHFFRDYESRRARVIREVTIAGPARALPSGSNPPAVTAATVTSLAEYRLRDLPETTRMTVRPIVWRTIRREAGRQLEAPTELEQADAIRWLADQPHDDTEPIYLEAFRILDEMGRGPEAEEA